MQEIALNLPKSPNLVALLPSQFIVRSLKIITNEKLPSWCPEASLALEKTTSIVRFTPTIVLPIMAMTFDEGHSITEPLPGSSSMLELRIRVTVNGNWN